jgi:hypothetical protein
MATEAHQSIDAERVARATDEKRRWRHVWRRIASPKRRDHRPAGGGPASETCKQSGERPDGHAQAA